MGKGEIIEGLVIESMAAEGKCVGRIDGKVIFLEGGAPGDTVNALITKSKSSYFLGRVLEVTQASPLRTTPICQHFGYCGGCSWQHIQYTTQLQYKQQQVVDNLERIGGLTLPPLMPIVPATPTDHYRNRLDFTFSAQRWKTHEEMSAGNTAIEPALGFHLPGKFDKVFDVKECHLQHHPSNAIRLAIKDEALKGNIPFFDLRVQNGFLRTLTLRTSTTGETMVLLQVAYEKKEWVDTLFHRLERDFPSITSFLYIINSKRNDTFQDQEILTWKGNGYLTETLAKPDGTGDLKFRISPKSFYQTNSQQAYHLYKAAWEMAHLTGKELVYDAYTGTGTIACFVAGQARKVIGLEYVESAVADARINAGANGILNTEFFAGDMVDLLNEPFLRDHGHPDVIITDPPRVGMHEDVCKMMLQAAPQRIVYVSCNPATQARDLKILCEAYAIEAIQPVDMFPHTRHVENVVGLIRKQ